MEHLVERVILPIFIVITIFTVDVLLIYSGPGLSSMLGLSPRGNPLPGLSPPRFTSNPGSPERSDPPKCGLQPSVEGTWAASAVLVST